MSMKETAFYTALNKLVPAEIYREKSYNPLRGGTPDFYYERRRNLWVEFKQTDLPARDSTIVEGLPSALQDDWLTRNYANGHEPLVIIGAKIGRTWHGMIRSTPEEWNTGLPCGDFKAQLMSLQSLANYIARKVL